jgi:hypothetical protein
VPWAEAVLAGPAPSVMANFVIRLIQIHFCFMYMSAGLAKLKGTMWWNTTAAWFTIANPEFTPMNHYFYMWTLRQLAYFKPVLNVVFAILVYFTLFTEIGLPFLVWTRLRPFMVGLGIMLHSGIAWAMGLTCFGLLMMTLLLSFVPSSVVRERIAWAPGTGRKLTLRFSGRNPLHWRLVAFLRAFDLSGQISLQDRSSKSPDEDGPVQLCTDDRQVYTGQEIIAQCAKNLAFLRMLQFVFWIPGVTSSVAWLTGASDQSTDGPHSAPASNTPVAKSPTVH